MPTHFFSRVGRPPPNPTNPNTETYNSMPRVRKRKKLEQHNLKPHLHFKTLLEVKIEIIQVFLFFVRSSTFSLYF